jgi:hypothetical protein
MTRVLTTTLLVLTVLMAKADLGQPSVHAVCRVTTADGKIYEGFVALMVGAIDGVHPNGFYLYQDDIYNSGLYSLTMSSAS